jgi:hypothetical protein
VTALSSVLCYNAIEMMVAVSWSCSILTMSVLAVGFRR